MIKVTDDIYLKSIELADAKDIFNGINSERERLREWLFFIDFTKTVEDSESFVKSVKDNNLIQYVIQYKGEFAGLIGFNNMDTLNSNAEIGYWLLQRFEKKGIIINSVKTLLEVGFNELNLHRIRIDVAMENAKSRSIPEKLNFTQEGIERESNKMCDGRFVDIVIYGLLKSEYKK